ncbi:ketosteroid isomerase, partial [Pseudomonas coronafaciens]
FVFRDGKICEHRDHFDMWRWSRQALGVKGLLLGWTPLVRNAVRAQALKGLKAFTESRRA